MWQIKKPWTLNQKAGVMLWQSTVLRDFDTELQMQTSDQK